MSIAFDRLVEAEGGYAVDFCEIGIEDYALVAYGENQGVDLGDDLGGF